MKATIAFTDVVMQMSQKNNSLLSYFPIVKINVIITLVVEFCHCA